MNAKTLNRMEGAVKVLVGVGMLTSATCCVLLGWWIGLPLFGWGGAKLGVGVAQLATGYGGE